MAERVLRCRPIKIATVHKQVSVGMPLQVAIANMGRLKLQCMGDNPLDCSRVRQGLMPYSCIERVRLHWSAGPQVVDTIDIRQIACAGP
jgi:hypothetical protein